MSERDQRIAEARRLLEVLNFDRERCNERSALVLLALAQLRPADHWDTASSPMLRTVEIMSWLRDTYDKDYQPNTRETIRRFTLHQFVQAGMVALNPDDPARPTNSPRNCYQLTPRALELIRTTGTSAFDGELRRYLADLPGLRAAYERAREMQRIPVAMPDGGLALLSPGGQNVLLKQMVEDFCGYFTPGAQVLYIGDAGDKWLVFEADILAGLGVTVESHGKMPDLIVYMPDRSWLVLLEAASSHGPVDAKRRDELAELFAGSSCGLVYVSCFPSRDEMRRFLPQIAWETEVWCADNPTHVIHFNGERFLGPYDT